MQRRPVAFGMVVAAALLAGSLGSAGGLQSARAADAAPLPTPEPEKYPSPAYDEWHRPVSQPSAALASLATEDRFGYRLEEAAPFAWLDALSGAPVTFSNPDDGVSDALDIGFDFEFYENVYRRVSVSTNGFLFFSGGGDSFFNAPMPQDTPPNGLIAPFWDDLELGSGQVYARQIEQGGQRAFVVAWSQVQRYGSSDRLTFEAVLFENGDVLFQYLELAGVLDEATTGIEDADGLDGLTALYNAPGLAAGKALRFYRPAAGPRVKALPPYQSGFSFGRQASFRIEIRNTGENGADTYDLGVTSSAPGWGAGLYAADGATPLGDSDGDGSADSGSIEPGGSKTIVVRARAPLSASAGDSAELIVLATSSQDSARSASATLRAAVPAEFAQAYADSLTGIHLSLYKSAYRIASRAAAPAPGERPRPGSLGIRRFPAGLGAIGEPEFGRGDRPLFRRSLFRLRSIGERRAFPGRPHR